MSDTTTTPKVLTVEPHMLNETRLALGLGIWTDILVRNLAAAHGIDDPEEEWRVYASDLVREVIERAVEWTVVESPATWKAEEAKAAER